MTALEVIQQRQPGFKPRVGVILGSGLGGLATQLDQVATISYDDLPGFPQAGVSGHQGTLADLAPGASPFSSTLFRLSLFVCLFVLAIYKLMGWFLGVCLFVCLFE